MLEVCLEPLNVVVIDCQTTHSSPQKGRVIEIAWSQTSALCDGSEPLLEQFLIQWPDEIELSARIQKLTGIRPDELKRAHSIQEVSRRFCEVISTGPPLVIHHASFEMPFLEQLFEAHYGISIPYPHSIVCTRTLARTLWPGLPRCSLRALAGFLGHQVVHQKRACAHVLATRYIWQKIVQKLRLEHGVNTWSDLQDWLLNVPPTKPSRRTFAIESTQRLMLPDAPGVYRLLNNHNEVLYVGKATSLKQRVNSYFRGKKHGDEKLLELITQVHHVDYTETETSLEAALLELEDFVETLEHRRKHAQHEVVRPRVARVLAAVHERVLLARMAVQVAEQLDFTFFLKHLHHPLREVDRRVEVLARLHPPSVQVEAEQRAAVVAVDHAVGVQHRDDLEDVVLSELDGCFVVAEQKLDEALDDP